MRHVTLGHGKLPALGMGTWNMGDQPAHRADESAALRAGLDAGLRVIDTAEMYDAGRSERLVGEAIAGRRDEVFLVSKVLPSNASIRGIRASCEASLKRLGCAQLDLYLLHWPGSVPLEETVEGFERIRADGLIGAWGVSNFGCADMEALARLSRACAANQILYSLEYRGVEFDLLARDAAQGVATMAYSPLGQGGRMLRATALAHVAARHETALGPATPAQIALAWVLRQPNVIAIPKTGSPARQKENVAACAITLGAEDLAMLDTVFSPPRKPVPLAML
jgi:diketogulonate reductase-like aldo/keto reductase